MATELTANAPAGLNVAAPAAAAYYSLPNEAAVKRHVDTNHLVRVYVFPSSERERTPRTRGTTAQSSPTTIEVTIAVNVREELGATDFVETWKTLTPAEREFLRCETYLGAIQDVMDSAARGPSTTGDDILQVEFIDSTTGADNFKRDPDGAGTWGAQRWRIIQIIQIPQQN